MSPLLLAFKATTDFGTVNPFAKLARIAGERRLIQEDGFYGPSATEFFATMRDAIGEARTRATLRAWRVVEDRRLNRERLAAWSNKAESFAEFGDVAVGKKIGVSIFRRREPKAVAEVIASPKGLHLMFKKEARA